MAASMLPLNATRRACTVSRPIAVAKNGSTTVADVRSMVFVVDEDRSVRETLETLIRAAGWEAETFESVTDFLTRPRKAVASCLVLPKLDGLELQQQLAERADLPIVFITGYENIASSVRAMRGGTVDRHMEPFGDNLLVAAVSQALARSHAELCRDDELDVIRACYATLTPRERDVMKLVVSGLLNKQVGGELGISEITVKAHRGEVMRKMRAGSLPDLVIMAARLGVRAMASHWQSRGRATRLPGC